MDTNPYKAPVSPPAPRSRLRSFFDITAAICAVSPIVFFATVIVIFITAPSLNPTDLVLNNHHIVNGGRAAAKRWASNRFAAAVKGRKRPPRAGVFVSWRLLHRRIRAAAPISGIPGIQCGNWS